MHFKSPSLIILLVVVLFLSSCRASDSPDQALKSITPSAEIPYPIPNGGAIVTYPEPLQQISEGDVAYPAPGSSVIFPEGEVPDAPTSAPQPQAGRSAFSGKLFSFTSRILIPETTLYLMPALGENKELAPLLTGPKPDAGDILLRSDANSEVMIDNVTPGAYFIIVWAPYSWAPVVNHTDGTDSPRLFEFEADKSYVLGLLELSWP